MYAGFANPPENFTCQARDQSFDTDSRPKAILHWSPPNFNTTTSKEYIVKYKHDTYTTVDTFYEIDLGSDALSVKFEVYVKDSFWKNGATRSCEIKTTLERRTCEFLSYLAHVFYMIYPRPELMVR